MAEHSPLPWKVLVDKRACFHVGNRVSIVCTTQREDGPFEETVAEVWPTPHNLDIADGQLIVAACNAHEELLAALRGLLPEEAGTKECDCGCEGDGEGMCDYADALNALAKAKGETS